MSKACDSVTVEKCVNEGKFCNIDTGNCILPESVKKVIREAVNAGGDVVINDDHGIISKKADEDAVREHIRKFGIKKLSAPNKERLKITMAKKTIATLGDHIKGAKPELVVPVPPQMRAPAAVAASAKITIEPSVDVEPVIDTVQQPVEVVEQVVAAVPVMAAVAPKAVVPAPAIASGKKPLAKPCDQAECERQKKICGVKGDCIKNTKANRTRMESYDVGSVEDKITANISEAVSVNIEAVVDKVVKEATVQVLQQSLDQAKQAGCVADVDCPAGTICDTKGNCVPNTSANRINIRLSKKAATLDLLRKEQEALNARIAAVQLADDVEESSTPAPVMASIAATPALVASIPMTAPVMASIAATPAPVMASIAATPAPVLAAVETARIIESANKAAAGVVDEAAAERVRTMVAQRAIEERKQAIATQERINQLSVAEKTRDALVKASEAAKVDVVDYYKNPQTNKPYTHYELVKTLSSRQPNDGIELRRLYNSYTDVKLRNMLKADDEEKRARVTGLELEGTNILPSDLGGVSPVKRNLLSVASKLGNKWADIKDMNIEQLNTLIQKGPAPEAMSQTLQARKEAAQTQRQAYYTRKFAGGEVGAENCITDPCLQAGEICDASTRKCVDVANVVYPIKEKVGGKMVDYIYVLEHNSNLYYGTPEILASVATEIGAPLSAIQRKERSKVEKMALEPENTDVYTKEELAELYKQPTVSKKDIAYAQELKAQTDAQRETQRVYTATNIQPLLTLEPTVTGVKTADTQLTMQPTVTAVTAAEKTLKDIGMPLAESNPAFLAQKINKVSATKPLSKEAADIARKIKECIGA